MINKLKLIRNIGQFDSVDGSATTTLARLTLVYAENGRGKTTLAAVFRSLATGDPVPITERRRLSAQKHPHIVLDCDGGPPPAVFENGAWNRVLANMVVFDDVFVDQNVYSGLAVEAEHRQNLHELILGAQGVALNRQLQQLISRIEEHNTELRRKAAAVPAAERGALSVDEFCALAARADIDEVIQATERALAAAHNQDAVRNTPLFDTLNLPVFDIAAIDGVLQEDMPSLDAAAAARVQAHVASLGQGGETWISEGMRLLPQSATGASTGTCPFCAQDLAGSSVIAHYRAYFSAAYADLKRRVSEALEGINRTHGGDAPAAFERAVRVVIERRQFWSRFCDVPELQIDTAIIVRDWNAAREAVARELGAKQGAPLERMRLTQDAREALKVYEAHRQRIAALGKALIEANNAIRVVKEQAAAANPQAIAADLARLRATKARHIPDIARLCDDYLAEKAAKAQTEQQRDQARAALDQYRTTVFPAYQTSVNLYLQRFNAGFRLDSVTSTNTRGGPACTYSVVINDTAVSVAGGTPSAGEPSFRNTLSAGDRNTLALAFFFALLDQDQGLANKVVVIDDPISSLDDHRSLTTVQETRRLAERAGQVIVLSHNKPFLCRIWEGADRCTRAALQLVRDGGGSSICSWDVEQDCITEHDRRHAMLREYLATGSGNSREVARSIRLHLEAFLRVACPEYFPPGMMLGPFHNRCLQRVGTPQQILDADATRELGDLKEYANRFHHDTNPAWETEVINDAELRGFVQRTLGFMRR
ncbi:MAG TPA: AAA family ATPase [Firmicutes bacterium]|nr:AAA family ATPase [Bacillota bacterium]